jgi:hypothetical protein
MLKGEPKMNRAERRRQAKNNAKAEKTYNVTHKQLVDMLEREQEETVKKATEEAFMLMMIISTMTFHDYAEDFEKEEKGVELFAQKCYDLFDTFANGYVTLDELKAQLKEEVGIEIKK